MSLLALPGFGAPIPVAKTELARNYSAGFFRLVAVVMQPRLTRLDPVNTQLQKPALVGSGAKARALHSGTGT